jgi:hypothetical protein
VVLGDPVAQGFVASIAKPGGNLTGFSALEFSIGGKWLELLKSSGVGALQDDELDLVTGGVRTYGPIMN